MNRIVVTFLSARLLSAAMAAEVSFTPADYATVETHSAAMVAYLNCSSNRTWKTYASATKDNAQRTAWQTASRAETPVLTLQWAGTTGDCMVNVRRARDNALVWTTNGIGSAVFPNPEIGRNYIWQVVQDGTTRLTGHFFTACTAPRMLNAYGGIGNARDLGGWTAADGSVVKQGLLFRSEEWDYVSDGDYDPGCSPKPYWRDTLGIALDVDLRCTNAVCQYYLPANRADAGLARSPIDPATVPRFTSELCPGAGPAPADAGIDAAYSVSADVKVSGAYVKHTKAEAHCAIYHIFTNVVAHVKAGRPVLFHCSQGKDRTGTFAYLFNGLLGVARADLNLDYAVTYAYDSEYTLSSWNVDKVYTAVTRYKSSGTLAAKTAAFLSACYVDAGSTADRAAADIAAFRAVLLESPEVAATATGYEDEHDEVSYREYWWFRAAGGGTWSSSTGYFYTDATHVTKCREAYGTDLRYPDAFDALVVLKPDDVEGYQYAAPACGDVKIGKLVTNGSKGLALSAGNSPTFIMTNRMCATRTLWRHEAGTFVGDNMDFTLYGTGTGSIDIYANATIYGTDLLANTPSTVYIRFPAGRSDGATLVCGDSGKGSSNNTMKFGWFEGGQAGTAQRLVVTNSFMRYTLASKTCQVGGALDLTLALGTNNLTTSATAPLGVSGTLVVNSGSSLTVDAGGKAAGTYPLVTAKKLTDNANLAASATITGLADGTAGSVVKSGNQLNLVIAAIDPDPEPDPEPDPDPEPEPEPTPLPVYDSTDDTWTFLGDTTYGFATNAVFAASRATFEANAALVVSNAATVAVSNVCLGASGNVFDVRDGAYLQLWTKAAAQAAGMTWTFNLDGASVSLNNAFTWQATDTVCLNLTNGAYFTGTGGNVSSLCTSMNTAIWKVSLVDSQVKFNDYSLSTAGCAMTIDNSTVKGNWGFVIGAKTATLALCGAVPCMRGANGPLTLGAKLTLTIRPERDWSATEGILRSATTSSNGKVTVASGVKYRVDVSELSGLAAAQTFCILSYPSTSGTCSITLPTAANVSVTGTGAENFTAAFGKSSDNRCLYLTVTPKVVMPYRNEETGESYATAQEAVEAAKPGEVVKVTANPQTSVMVRLKAGVVVDTQGFPNVSVAAPDPWFDITAAAENRYCLSLNELARPTIEGTADRHGFAVSNGWVFIHAEPLCSNLYYGVATAESPVALTNESSVGTWIRPEAGEGLDFRMERPASAASAFYRIFVRDRKP